MMRIWARSVSSRFLNRGDWDRKAASINLIRGGGGRGGFQWHMGANVEAKATKANVLGFVPAEEAHFPDAELPENLGAHPEFTVAHDLGLGRPFIRHAGGVGVPAQIRPGRRVLPGR